MPGRNVVAALCLLLALPLAVRAGEEGKGPDAAAEHAALEKAWSAARTEYYRALRAGEKAAPPEDVFLPRFAAAAERYAGTKDAVPFLLSLVSIGRSSATPYAAKALDTLLGHHVESPALVRIVFSLMYGGPGLPPDAVARALDRVALDSPHPDVKAAFLYARAFRTNRDRNATAADRRAAALNLEMAERLAPDSRYAEMAERLHFEITRLQIGMPAPEIEGTDLEGKPMKLSDFRGKVVVLDFWGDW